MNERRHMFTSSQKLSKHLDHSCLSILLIHLVSSQLYFQFLNLLLPSKLLTLFFQIQNPTFQNSPLLAIPFTRPLSTSFVPCLSLSSFAPFYSSSSPVCPEDWMRLISPPAHCQREKWEHETLRDTKQAFDSNGIMRWGLNIKITEEKCEMSNGHLNRGLVTLYQS